MGGFTKEESFAHSMLEAMKPLLSDAAIKELNKDVRAIGRQVAHEGLTKKQAVDAAREMMVTIVADLDGADGAFDHKVSKEAIRNRIDKMKQEVGKTKEGKKLLKDLDETKIEKALDKLGKGEVLSDQTIYDNFDPKIAEAIGGLFKRFDLNKDNKISEADIQLKMQDVMKDVQPSDDREHGVPARPLSRGARNTPVKT